MEGDVFVDDLRRMRLRLQIIYCAVGDLGSRLDRHAVIGWPWTSFLRLPN